MAAATPPRSTTTHPSRWVSRTRDERFEGVERVVVRLAAGRIELGSRSGRTVRVRTTSAIDGWRARLARRRDPEAPAARCEDGVLRLEPAGQVRAQIDVPPGLVVDAEIARGDLTLWGVTGELRLGVGSGILAGRDLRGPLVRASNAGGEVNLHFASVPETVEASSPSGPVLLVLPAGSYTIDADPGAEVTVTTDDAAAARIRTSSGGRTAILAAMGSEPI
jgi:hypothetical protein